INETLPKILNNTEGQVGFVELSARPEILPGQVIRFDLGGDIDASLTETRRAQIEAQCLAKWIRDAGLQKLRARCWREVAILCPRKAWLRAIRDALVEQQIPVEVQSESDRQAEHPAYAWLTAVLEIVRMTQLRERLRTLPREEFGNLANNLEKLLSAAAAAEARKESLADFALTLRRNLDELRETEPAEADAVQLITAHKAKGSEWDTVIVPFLAREARLGVNIRYPLVIGGEQPFIAFDRSDRADLE